MKVAVTGLPICFIVLLVSACGQAAQPASAKMATRSIDTRDATETSFAKKSPTLLPPTRTQIPTNTVDLWDLESTTTQIAIETQIAHFSPNCEKIPHDFLVSPDGNWLALQCGGLQNVVISSRDSSKYLEIPIKDIYHNIFPSESIMPNINYFGSLDVKPILWSSDSIYVYLQVYTIGVDVIRDYRLSMMDSVPSYIFYLDIRTGNWARFISTPIYYFSFSPTGRYFIYVIRKGWNTFVDSPLIEITVCDITTGKQTKITLADYVAAANIVWSEDGDLFVFSADKGPPWNFQTAEIISTYIIYLVDATAPSLSTIKEFPDMSGQVYPTEWVNNTVTIYSDYYDSEHNNTVTKIYYLDVSLNQFIDQTPTPVLTPTL